MNVRMLLTFGIWNPHDFCGGVRMVERRLGGELSRLLVERDDLDFVVVLFDEGPEGQAEPLVRPHRPVHRVDLPRRLVLVNLLPLGRRSSG